MKNAAAATSPIISPNLFYYPLPSSLISPVSVSHQIRMAASSRGANIPRSLKQLRGPDNYTEVILHDLRHFAKISPMGFQIFHAQLLILSHMVS